MNNEENVRSALAEFRTGRERQKALHKELIRLAVELGQDQGAAMHGGAEYYLDGLLNGRDQRQGTRT